MRHFGQTDILEQKTADKNLENFPLLEEVSLQAEIKSDRALPMFKETKVYRHLQTPEFLEGYFSSDDLKMRCGVTILISVDLIPCESLPPT